MSEEKPVISTTISAMLRATAVAAVLWLAACNGGPTDPPGDTTPPTILSVSPAEDAVDVPVDALIRVVFSEAIDTSRVTTATFIVNPAITGSFGFRGDTVTITPASSLAYSTTYIVSVTTGVADPAGNRLGANKNWSFTTVGDPATTPPRVIATIPPTNATDVDAAAAITATFSKVLDPATLTPSSFTVDGVTGTVSYAEGTAVFTPNDTLAFNTLHTVRLDTTVADTFGNHLTAPYVWSFTTGDDPMIPTALIWSPADNVIIGDTITVTILADHPVAVTKVEFYVDGLHIAGADDGSEPFEFFWDASSQTLGSQHWIHARAYEAEGRVGFSDTIMVYCQWEPLITDANDLWATDIKTILARSTDTAVEFRYEFWEPWFDPYDTIPDDTTLDLGIYIDADRNPNTGRTTFGDPPYAQPLNGLGADYRVIVGIHGWIDALAVWTGAWQTVYDYTGFQYLNLPPYASALEFGMKWTDMGNPQSIYMLSINVFFESTESFLPDWAPDRDAGYLTVRRENRYNGEGYTESPPRTVRRHQAASPRGNPF